MVLVRKGNSTSTPLATALKIALRGVTRVGSSSMTNFQYWCGSETGDYHCGLGVSVAYFRFGLLLKPAWMWRRPRTRSSMRKGSLLLPRMWESQKRRFELDSVKNYMVNCASHLWTQNPLNGRYKICSEIKNAESADFYWSGIRGAKQTPKST